MKTHLKKALDTLALVAILPPLTLYRIAALIAGPEKAFPGWSQAFGLIPGLTGVYLRRAFYRRTLSRCGPDTCLSFGSLFSHPGTRVGRGVYTGAYCCIGRVVIEDDVLIASFVSVMDGGRQHGVERLDVPIRTQPGVSLDVTVGQGSWIGERAVVMADVGKHCVVGAGSVVTRPIPDYAIAVGVPARVVGSRKPVELDVAS